MDERKPKSVLELSDMLGVSSPDGAILADMDSWLFSQASNEIKRLQTMLDASNEQLKLYAKKYHDGVELVVECYGLTKENERLKDEVDELNEELSQKIKQVEMLQSNIKALSDEIVSLKSQGGDHS